jgi:RNA polymerase sigma-70 factor, ECF subfamily
MSELDGSGQQVFDRRATHPRMDAAARLADESDVGDGNLVARLRAGDEGAFAELVDAWSPVMLRVAMRYVANRQAAEDVVQDTWLALIKGLSNFQGRSTLRSWAFSILINRAKTRGAMDFRTVVSATLTSSDSDVPAVDPARFRGADDEYPGHWTSVGAPRPWDQPEGGALGREVVTLIDAALEDLPSRQRLVVTLRDVHGMTSEEACAALELSPQNQRVLLHRGRAALRTALEDYYHG